MAPRRDVWSMVALAAVGLAALALPQWKPQSRAERGAAPGSRLALTPPATLRPAKDETPQIPATSPWRLSWRDWKAVLWATYKQINDNRLLAVAAGVVFYCLLALFPAMAAFVSIYGLVSDPSRVDSHLAMVSGILPAGALAVLHEELGRLTANRSSTLSIGLIVSTLIALWSANAGVKSILDALNVANDRKETRSFVRLNLVAFVFTIGGFLAAVFAVSAVVVAPLVFRYMGLVGIGDRLIQAARWPVLLAFIVFGLAVLYRYGPCPGALRCHWLSVGAVAAAIAWIAASLGFSWYIAHFGDYDATYGSLGAGIGMMTWMWISMIVVLVGAELNVEIDRLLARGRDGLARSAASR